MSSYTDELLSLRKEVAILRREKAALQADATVLRHLGDQWAHQAEDTLGKLHAAEARLKALTEGLDVDALRWLREDMPRPASAFGQTMENTTRNDMLRRATRALTKLLAGGAAPQPTHEET